MYQIKVNDKCNFEIDLTNNQYKIGGEVVELDIHKLNATSSNVLYKNKSYNIEVIELDNQEKTATVKVNGNIYSITIKDQFDQLLKQLGMDNLTVNKIAQIKAPMPGLVLNVLVAEGHEIKKGDNLLVLEAMKMENMIKSPTDGIIKKLEIKRGDKVEKNQLLVIFS